MKPTCSILHAVGPAIDGPASAGARTLGGGLASRRRDVSAKGNPDQQTTILAVCLCRAAESYGTLSDEVSPRFAVLSLARNSEAKPLYQRARHKTSHTFWLQVRTSSYLDNRYPVAAQQECLNLLGFCRFGLFFLSLCHGWLSWSRPPKIGAGTTPSPQSRVSPTAMLAFRKKSSSSRKGV